MTEIQKLRNQLNILIDNNKSLSKSKYIAFKKIILTARTKKLNDLLDYFKTANKVNVTNFKKNVALKKIQVDKNIFKLDDDNIRDYKIRLHYDLMTGMMRKNPNNYYTHSVQFLNKYTAHKNPTITISSVDLYQKSQKQYNTKKKKNITVLEDFYLDISLKYALNEYSWICEAWTKNTNEKDDKPEDIERNFYQNGNYCLLTTTCYKKVENIQNIKFNQLYQLNNNNTCVYDGFLEYFNDDDIIKKKNIYKKLIKEASTYAKGYTNDTLKEICEFTKSSLTIKDLLSSNDIIIRTANSRYHLTFFNTRHNHLDFISHPYNNPIEVENKEELENIKNVSDFYIEEFGKVITLKGSYKVKDDAFNIEYKAWKEFINYNDLPIKEESQEMELINNYDYSTHCFFNEKLPVKNELYDELDIEKAYFQYSDKTKNPNYHGVPSGSFINIKITNNCDINTFNEQLKNNIIGYYEVVVKKINSQHKIFKKIGINENEIYVFTSVQINSFKNYIDFVFLNISISPCIHIPFTEGMKNKIFTTDDKKGLSYYCKAFGIMLKSTDHISMTVKPLLCDLNYYNIINNENINIYEKDGIIKINKKNQVVTNCKHIGYYIHSYVKTLVFEQLLKIDDINNVFGIKIDSIVLKKGSIISKILPAFYTDYKICNIESMIDVNKINNNKIRYYEDEIEEATINGYYRDFFKCNMNDINFNPTFLPNNEMITSSVIFCGGKGGSGKSHSICKNNKSVCMVSSCWNLTANKKEEYGIRPLSINKLIGHTMGKTTEKVIVNDKILFLDELTMWERKDVLQVISEYKHKFIFLAGDINYNGDYFQCSLQNLVFRPSEIKNLQYVKYTKNYRFNEQLDNLLDGLRKCLTKDKQEAYIKLHFKNNFKNKENIIWTDKIRGISDLKDNKELEEYFINKGAKPIKYIKTTNFNKREFKGAIFKEDTDTAINFEYKLFKSIHSYQGLDIKDDETLVINNKLNFDRNLWYTALSRARNLQQIIILI